MKKEWILLLTITALTVGVALALLRWFAPQLLGIPVDLQMVRVSDEVVPFFANVFRPEDYASEGFILRDPHMLRAKPLHPDHGWEMGVGPHDILGFRNRGIPNQADIICIGDSQTYGNNAILEENWPHRLQAELRYVRQYSMAVGGWGPVEYLQIFRKALLFHPRVVIVAFYTGNDPIDGFSRVYAKPEWQHLRPDPGLTSRDAPPPAPNPPQPGDIWEVTFQDGFQTIFTPRYRLVSNQAVPAVQAGYEIMAKVAAEIVALAQQAPAPPRIVFTIVPTKALVYANKVAQAEVKAPDNYQQLIRQESANLDLLRAELQALDAVYVDILAALQKAALSAEALYPPNTNGHPFAPGYAVIGETISAAVDDLLPVRPAIAGQALGKTFRLWRITDERRPFASPQIAAQNGWMLDKIPMLTPRERSLPIGEVITRVDPPRFGPGHANVAFTPGGTPLR